MVYAARGDLVSRFAWGPMQKKQAALLNEEVQRETHRLEKDGRQLLDSVRAEMTSLALRRKEFEAFDERPRRLRGAR